MLGAHQDPQRWARGPVARIGRLALGLKKASTDGTPQTERDEHPTRARSGHHGWLPTTPIAYGVKDTGSH